jgi:AMMECR1 domain-containing protein
VLWPGTGIEAGSISGTLVPQVPVMQRADMVLFLGMFAGTS